MSKLLKDVRNINEDLSDYTNSPSWNHHIFYDNNGHSREYLEKSSKAITPVLPTEEPEYSLSIWDEHLSTILETDSNELIKSRVENLVLIPSEYEVTSDNESECNVPVNDESSLIFTTFSNPLFDCNDDFTSSDDESLSNEDVLMENFKIYLNPLFDDEEIISIKIDPHYFNAESNLIESLPNRDTLFDSSPKFDYLEELSSELMPTSIINEERIKREHEEYIILMEKLLTINAFPRVLEKFHANMIIETLPTSLIPVKDSDSLREEIDIFFGTDDLMSPSIESDDSDSEGDIHFLEELLSNDSIPLPENESSNFDHHDDLSFPCPHLKPPDVEVFFDFEPNSGELISTMTNNIYELNEDECFDPVGESANQKGIKTVEGEMQETLDTRQGTMERELQNRMNIKLWSSDVEDSPVNDRFVKVKGIHAVHPPMIGNYMPPKSDFGIDESEFTYGRKQFESKPKVVNEPKVWSDAPIIEEYESDSNDEYVSKASVEQEKPSCAFINIVRHVKTPRQTIQDQDTCSQNPIVKKRDWTGLKSKNRFPVNAARQKFSSQTASTSTARKVNTARPIVNEIRPRHNVYKSHSHIRRPFNRTTTPKANFAQHKVNTAGDKLVSAIEGKWETVVKASTGNKAYLVEYQDFNGGPVALENKVLFTYTECLVLSPDFKLADKNQVLLRVPKQNNMYSFNLENIVSSGGLACLIAKATIDKSTKWHRRNAHVKRKAKRRLKRLDHEVAAYPKVSTACYVLNRVLVTKPQNKTPYELLTGKFEEKSDEGFFVGYSPSSKAFREEEANDAAATLRKSFAQSIEDLLLQVGAARASSTNYVNTTSTPVNAASTPINTASTPTNQDDSQIPSLEDIYEVLRDEIFTSASYDDEGVVADFTNLESTMTFWNTASSQTINDEKKIHATVDSKEVVVTEASITSSLLFNDADGNACLTSEAIFQNLALMGYQGELVGINSLRQILHPNTLETIIQSSANISERPIVEFVQFINPHQPVLLIFILIDDSSWIGVSGVFHTSLDYDASCEHSKRDVESKAFFDRQICQLSLNQKHDSDDSTFRVDIASRLPVDSKSIELLSFATLRRDSPESMLVVAYWFLNPHCARHQVFNPLDVPIVCFLCLGDRSCVLVT
uniref:Ribonuclease H-like domain-containing protein n=1 Tax=Tanacetum cinerariifolium TaxID=118510 RepID=A0A6L2P062_TANCI|nr:ribonuclease H-like domain-containing protein [Tanacetum cinerariifolium]